MIRMGGAHEEGGLRAGGTIKGRAARWSRPPGVKFQTRGRGERGLLCLEGWRIEREPSHVYLVEKAATGKEEMRNRPRSIDHSLRGGKSNAGTKKRRSIKEKSAPGYRVGERSTAGKT